MKIIICFTDALIMGVFLLLLCSPAYTQSKNIDSLRIALGKNHKESTVLLQLSKLYIYDRPDSSFYFANEVLKVGDKKYFSQAYDLIGNSFVVRAKYDSAHYNYFKALEYVNDANQVIEVNKMGILLNIAQLASVQNKNKNALDTFALIESVVTTWSESEEKNKDLMFIYGASADILSDIGLQDKAIDYLYKSIKITQQTKNENAEAANWNRLGKTYNIIGNNKKAIECASKGLALAQKNRNAYTIGRSLYLMSLAYLEINYVDSANYYNSLAYKIADSTQNVSALGTTLDLQGKILNRKGEYQQAINVLKQAIHFEEKNQLYVSKAVSLFNIGKAFYSLSNIDSAIFYYKSALPAFIKENEYVKSRNVYRKLMEAYIQKGETGLLYSYLDAYDSSNQRYLDDEKIKAITAQEIKYETSLKEATISTQKVELAAKRKQNVWLLIGGSVALIAATGLALLYRRISRQKAQIHNQKQEILHNNRNSLQQLISIFSRQAANETDSGTAQQNQERLMTLNLLNKMLYEHGGTESIPASSYVTELCKLKQIGTGNSVAVNVQATVEKMAASQLKDVGLIINELVTNSIKHAFTGIAAPAIHIRLIQNNKQELELHISDNGNGLPAGFNIASQRQSFGLSYVADLVQQHHGSIETYNNNGANFKITMKLRTHA